MENKELVSSGKITQSLIGYWLLWGIVFSIFYSIVLGILSSFIRSTTVIAIISVILQGTVAFLIWKFSTYSSFKKKTISYNDVSKVMRNLIIFTVIVCLINGAYNFLQINNSINKAMSAKSVSNLGESFYKTESLKAIYEELEQKAIDNFKKQSYTRLAILEIGLTVMYLAVLPLEKKEILKYID